MNAPGTLALVRLSGTRTRNQTVQVSLGEVTFKRPALDCKNVRGRITPTRSPSTNEIGPTNLGRRIW
jgi:hypothetical protein